MFYAKVRLTKWVVHYDPSRGIEGERNSTIEWIFFCHALPTMLLWMSTVQMLPSEKLGEVDFYVSCVFVASLFVGGLVEASQKIRR
jgi:hypothetical protein